MTFEDAEPRSPIELTRDEMLAISAEISFKFSPDKTAPAKVTAPPPAAVLREQPQIEGFSHRELQAIGRDISQRYAPKASNRAPEITLLPVDPLHLYAYWDTGPGQTPITADHKPQKPLTLRIYWRPDATREITRSNIWFDIPAGRSQSRKQIRLPIDNTFYSAALGKLNPDRSLDVLAHSNLVHVPTAPNNKRLAIDHPAQQASTAKEPAFAVRHLQGILSAARQEGAHFPEDWSIKLHPSSPADPISDPAKLYTELMSIFKFNRIDAELIPEPALRNVLENPPKNASGLGL
ncbi:DUF4912 domain-containing protein [Methylomicrobium sp. Wu6]|uniref:DUF4912 domain-containing protein n=1 Tax=Methylomicrobium sp. Wu6 TaxID=3107928 RepID=UPI002DD6AAF8|nr:DUF4912 domain-containing protein [Methylomicrobium sp. Wu6]